MRKIRSFAGLTGLDGPGKSLYNSQYRKAGRQGRGAVRRTECKPPERGSGLNFETRCALCLPSKPARMKSTVFITKP